MKESHLRSMLKAFSWRIFGTFATVAIAFILTHKFKIAFYIGFLEFTLKIALFYLHERLWSII